MPTATRSKKSDVPALPIADRTLTNLTQVFKLLADESRLRILLTLAREGETHVSALCQMLGQSQPAVSHHLTLLRMAGLVGFRRAGKFNFYRMDAMMLGDLLERLFADAGRSSAINMGEFSLSFSRNSGRRR
jgi:ArsR family transcriptional regulator, arsenate/arsenite/antimonite-responsive transcriptional repressor